MDKRPKRSRDKYNPYILHSEKLKNIYNKKLAKALETLTKEQRKRILLYYDYQLTMEEIARIEGCAKQSVQESFE